MPKPNAVSLLVRDYMNKYPSAMKKSLARMIVDENPLLFPKMDYVDRVEKIRDYIRYHSNSIGKHSPNAIMMTVPHSSHVEIPPDLKLKQGKALIISDIHGFYHTDMLHEYFEIGKKEDIDTVILNGDILECEKFAKWQQMENRVGIQDELDFLDELLHDIEDYFPDAKLIFKKGNHEIWIDRKLWENPTVMESRSFRGLLNIENLIGMNKNGSHKNWTVIQDRQGMWLGKLLLLHGHESKKSGMYVAKNMLEYFKTDVAFGHFHRIDRHQFEIYGGKIIRSWALPCARQMQVIYTGINNQWSCGFAICEFTKDNYTMSVYVEDNGKINRV